MSARPRVAGSRALKHVPVSGSVDRARSAASRARHRHRGPQGRAVQPPRWRRIPFLIASFLVVGTLVVGVVSLQALVSQGSFRMQQLTRHNLELEQEYGRLKLEVAELSAPGRVAGQARRLGFRLPEGVQALRVKGPVRVGAGAGTGDRPVFSLKGSLEQRP
jgi:cell division protein FtsL